MEVSLDEVDAVNRSRVVGRFVELEVELVKGDEAGLDEIAAVLASDKGLAPADSSKLESALKAITAMEPRRSKKNGRVLPPIDVDDADGGERFDDGLDVGRIVAAALGEASRGTPTNDRAARADEPATSASADAPGTAAAAPAAAPAS